MPFVEVEGAGVKGAGVKGDVDTYDQSLGFHSSPGFSFHSSSAVPPPTVRANTPKVLKGGPEQQKGNRSLEEKLDTVAMCFPPLGPCLSRRCGRSLDSSFLPECNVALVSVQNEKTTQSLRVA